MLAFEKVEVWAVEWVAYLIDLSAVDFVVEAVYFVADQFSIAKLIFQKDQQHRQDLFR